MVSFNLSTLILCLAALTTAKSSSKSRRQALSPNEFSLTLSSAVYGAFPVTALPSGDPPSGLYLVFDKPVGAIGTPTYLNGTYLNFDLGNSSAWGIYLSDVGQVDGLVVNVIAFPGRNSGTPGFQVGSDGNGGGGIGPPYTSPDQEFFACNQTIDGVEYLALNWGNFNENGSNPAGCVAAGLRTVDDIVSSKK